MERSKRMEKVENKKSGLATAGLVLGIIGICLSFIPILNNASFFLGILLRKYANLYNICIKQIWSYTFCIFIFVIFFTSRYFIQGGLVPYYLYKLGYYVLPLVGSLFFFNAFANGLFIKIRTILNYIGRKSLPIYILHILFVIQIPQIGEFILEQNAVTSITIQLLYSVLFSLIAILLSLVSYKLISISPLFKKILFGE